MLAPSPHAAETRRLLLGVALLVFAVGLLAQSRERPWTDATAVWEVAERLISEHRIDIKTHWPYDAPAGRDGRFYAFNPAMGSLVHVPGAAVRLLVGRLWPSWSARVWPLAAHLAPAALGGVIAALFLLLALEHGIGRRRATFAALASAFGTTTWVYSRYPYTEIVQATAFLGAFLYLARLGRELKRRDGVVLGLWLSALLNTKMVLLAGFPLAALYLVRTHRAQGRTVLTVALAVGAGLVPGLVLAGWYNWARFGSAFSDGYAQTASVALSGGSLINGLWGMLLSPGKSLFLYSPPLLAACFGLPGLIRRRASTAVLMALTVLPPILIHARLSFWHGDFAWGPRYCVFAVPVLCLGLPFAIEAAVSVSSRAWRRAALALVWASLAGGLLVQLVGSAFYWDHFIRIGIDVRGRWLGESTLAGALVDGKGKCHVCTERLYGLHWLPQLQPIRGHLWLLRHVPFGHPWTRAEPDAPWHSDTSAVLDVADGYKRARVDWWGLDFGSARGFAVCFAAVAVALGLWGLVLLRRGLVKPTPSEASEGDVRCA